jgi:hypothetical protein
MKGVKYGARYFQVAEIKKEKETGLPEYENKTLLGGLRTCAISIQTASGELYGDDQLVLKVDEFVSGTADVETSDVDDDVLAAILGAKLDGKTIINSADDVPPMCGAAFFGVFKRTKDDATGNAKKGDAYYRGVYLPKVQAQIGDDTYETKDNNIKFGANNLKFTIYATNDGKWRMTERFADESAAIAWCDKKLGKATAPTGGGSGT